MNQKNVFLESEGDAWFQRNKDYFDAWDPEKDFIINELLRLKINPTEILEVGCAGGKRLNALSEKLNAKAYGIDPSKEAVEYASKVHPDIIVNQATSDDLPYENNKFDLLLSGFCLYLADREDLFKIAAEYDRVLNDGGLLVIWDFYSNIPHRNKYSHFDGLYSYKLDYASMFSWNPDYKVVRSIKYDHSNNFIPTDRNDIIELSIIRKDKANSYLDGLS